MTMQHEIVIRNALDIITARMEVREMARRLGLNLTDQAIISMAVYMLANSLGLGSFGAPEGQINIESCQKENRRGIQVRCSQKGQNISLPSTAYFEKMVDQIDLKTNTPGTLEVILTMWAKS